MDERNTAASDTLKNILDGMPLGVYVSDIESDEILFVNSSFKGIYPGADTAGKKCFQLLKSGAVRRCDNCPVLTLKVKPDDIIVWEDEVCGRIFKKTDKLIKWPDGRLVHMQYSEDITEEKQREYSARRQAEEQLIKAKETAEQVNLAKSEFLMNLSHEMRTPLNAIIGMTNIAKSAEDKTKKEYCLQKVDNAAKHLLAIINDILDITKIESSELQLSEIEFSFEDMLAKTVSIVNTMAEEKGQNLIVTLDPELNSALLADEMRLSQVITNLLGNAVKFTHDYGVIKLNVKKLKEDKQTVTLRIEVADNGKGISPEHQQKLFKPFVQAEQGTKKSGGTGLGLAICKRIVELMNGEIGVNSVEGVGSTFWFTLQLKKGLNSKKNGLGLGINRENLNVLVVDENSETREYFLSVLGLAELPCIAAGSAGEALNKIDKNKSKPYNVIFIGDGLKEISATGLAKKIKELAFGAAVILITSHTKWAEIEDAARQAGVAKYIVRPIFPSLIINSINEVIGSNAQKGTFSKKAIKNKFKGNNVLIVEDIEVNREIMISLFEDTGVSVDTANNGVQGISRLKENPDKYDLILMDIHMPDMDGHKATKTIRSLENKKISNIPIVAMTANVFKEDIEKCMQSGMNGHIGKPIDPDELFMILGRFLKENGNAEAKEIKIVHKKKPVIFEQLLPELDIKEGLARLMNNKKLYVNLLKGFSGRKMTDELKAAVTANDYNKCISIAQALKSVSSNLGLIKLAGIAAAIEAAGRMGAPMAEKAVQLEDIAAKTITAIETLLSGEL